MVQKSSFEKGTALHQRSLIILKEDFQFYFSLQPIETRVSVLEIRSKSFCISWEGMAFIMTLHSVMAFRLMLCLGQYTKLQQGFQGFSKRSLNGQMTVPPYLANLELWPDFLLWQDALMAPTLMSRHLKMMKKALSTAIITTASTSLVFVDQTFVSITSSVLPQDVGMIPE